uniref:CCDC66 domain-containing protein n=2 Tax=Heliothis virescens TaxID=7102 RepID=A0A2A4JRT1_HELVI
MLSSSNIERLIAEKRREIEREKLAMGLMPPVDEQLHKNVKQDTEAPEVIKAVSFTEIEDQPDHNDSTDHQEEKNLSDTTHKEPDDSIPPDLERYIRRYIGLPVMLKAGEYSPNNPLVRGERAPGDVLLGLGEYERRRNTLRKIRQQQYREYLDQQAKKKQEAKEQAERERREREQKEREREERERELLQERERYSAERRRSIQYVPETTSYSTNKVDTGIQVDGFSCPLSVAVQTDDDHMFRLPGSNTVCELTQAERELSPRSAVAAHWQADTHCGRRRSYGDFDERTSTLVKKSNRDKLTSELRHQYMPSIFDADAIQLRNLQAEKEAAERRQFYQQELKNQILEQQRIREERKTREKMLEQAEMRRLEEQLRMLRVAQDREIGKQHDITAATKESTTDYHSKRTELQREIEAEQRNLRAASLPHKSHQRQLQRNTNTSRSDTNPSKLPFYYPSLQERNNEITDKKPYSINIPDNSIFSANYDVDSYLRRNLNFNKEKPKTYEKDDDSIISLHESKRVVEKALVHNTEDKFDRPIEKEPSYKKNIENVDTLPIPVLRHSPKKQEKLEDNTKMSEAMKKVDDKWKVPAVQKNILKALPNEEGKSVNILTQLGSIRRQLQLEQLKLDKMNKDDV